MSAHRTTRVVSVATALTLGLSLAACDSKNTATKPSSSGSQGSSSNAPGSSSSGSSTTNTTAGQLSPTGADLSAYTGQQVNWSKTNCPSEVTSLNSFSLRDLAPINARTQCAKIKAPKDYADPKKGDLELLVTRTTASKSTSPRVLFTNPGGPGGPAAAFSVLTAALSPLGQTDDVIGVDPRGTGGSSPIPCKTYYPSDVDDSADPSASTIAKLQAGTKRTVDDCVRDHGDVLPYITTDNTARDQDLVRRLLGKDTIDYYGVSAGTWLGARYATLFPKQVGRFVLDSNTDFTASFSESFGTQPMSFQRRFDQQLLPWLARHNATYQLGSTPEQVRSTYADIRKAAGDKKLGQFYPDLIDNVVSHTMYNDRGFESAGALLALLNQARNGDTKSLLTAEGALRRSGSSDDVNAARAQNTVFMAVTCNDTPWDKNPNSYVDQGKQNGKKYPLIGWNTTTNPCAYWPYTAPQTKVDTSAAPPMLMVQTEDDPATAYEGAISAHEASPNTRLLSVDDQGNHGAVLGAGNRCVEQATYGFLQNGTMIDKDSVCPGIPLPKDDQVYKVGFTPEGQSLTMPPDTTPGWKKALLAVLQEILDKLIQPPSSNSRS